jgi:hypothetical protein
VFSTTVQGRAGRPAIKPEMLKAPGYNFAAQHKKTGCPAKKNSIFIKENGHKLKHGIFRQYRRRFKNQ